MAQLISVTAFVVDSTVQSPSTTYAIAGDHIKAVTAATTRQKQAAPSASQGINTAVYYNDNVNNSGTDHVYLVNESVATIVSGS